ncbi:rRNA-processing protein fcf2 [Galdieria sulphuraria]|uniref:Fcf2 pre-rRNA processing C-terminal domain-containing protein n=1 Tax=Galdieria sulphuraria TaxID=130081 RepID=M2VTT3_GALSU|nr:uncharacterized protein Gasu_57300 [Galdieria sulphuraria]EME26606.1 hypothetical protein Gasu_57300 [Galdieria sulphuraria]GJD08704.1 rRNA-processing protein fcf2 [Galdieria sulphuraria]|eukprot:XP_005703126.1 hypothetical protein Gasu_57300 [Galdieria sulphuraria]
MSHDNSTNEEVIRLLPELENDNDDKQVSSEYGKIEKWMQQLSTPWSQKLLEQDNDELILSTHRSEKPIVPFTIRNERLDSLIDINWATFNQEQQREMKKKRETLGRDWFNMPAIPSNDIETQKAVKLLHLRRFIYPNRFYKSLGTEKSSHRFYQVGTVQDQPEEFFSNRLPRKERKNTFVEEFLSDPDLRTRTKERFKKIQTEKQKLVNPKKWKKRIQRTLPKWKRK